MKIFNALCILKKGTCGSFEKGTSKALTHLQYCPLLPEAWIENGKIKKDPEPTIRKNSYLMLLK
jgi:hypothetical protein